MSSIQKCQFIIEHSPDELGLLREHAPRAMIALSWLSPFPLNLSVIGTGIGAGARLVFIGIVTNTAEGLQRNRTD